MAAAQFDMEIYERIDFLPHFNPDLDQDQAPLQVMEFRRQIKVADGVLICTPEYAMGVPGSLKNALDWTVSSMEFAHKPVALITASLDGHHGHQSLLDTLKVIECKLNQSTQLVIPFIKTKVNALEGITDPPTFVEIQELISAFKAEMDSTNEGDGNLFS